LRGVNARIESLSFEERREQEQVDRYDRQTEREMQEAGRDRNQAKSLRQEVQEKRILSALWSIISTTKNNFGLSAETHTVAICDFRIRKVQRKIEFMKDTTGLLTVESIRNCVYTIRGQQVMLDYDLASIHGYEVKRLNEQVKRNINRFPEDFMFQLTMDEVDLMKSHFATSSQENLKSQNATSSWGGKRKLPYAFTEQGIYMLATVLRGELAEQQSIFIMRAFKEMRHYIRQNQQFVTQSEMSMVTAKV